MNTKMVDAALKAITDTGVESADGWCCRFVRQVTEKVYGKKFDGYFEASAIETAHAFKAAQLAAIPANRALQPGDVLFKTVGAGEFGHVGIYIGNGLVAENSSTSIGRVSGAKGFRSLKQFGNYQWVGRFPSA